MAKLAIEELDGHLRISVPWFRLSFDRVAISSFAVVFTLLFGAIAASSLGIFTDEEGVRSVGGFLLSTAVVIMCIYVLAAYWTNRTTLDVSHDTLSVFTKPFPLPWMRKVHALAIADVTQLFVQEIQNGDSKGNRLASSYAVSALLGCGERVMLLDVSDVTGMSSDAKNPAQIIEERIEAFLRIENGPVEKEVIERVHNAGTKGWRQSM